MSVPNFYRTPRAFSTVRIGGHTVRALLLEVDGTEIGGKWDEQAPTGSNGVSWVWKGMKPAGPHKLTFLTVNAREEADIRTVLEMLLPKPTGSGAAPIPDQYTIGQTKDASADGAPVSPTGDVPKTGGVYDADKDGFPTTKTPSVGPKPPTLTIENGFLAQVGTTAVSFQSYKFTHREDNAIAHVFELVPQKPLTPAGVGVAATRGSEFALAPARDADTDRGGNASADRAAAQAGAGT